MEKQKSKWYKSKWAYGIAGALLFIAVVAGTIVALHFKNNSNNVKQATNTAPTNSTVSKPVVTSPSPSTLVWKASVDPTALPLGDGHVASTPQVGYVDSCTLTFRGGGARHAGNWINGSTWNMTTKVAVNGSTQWPSAQYSVATSGADRILTTNDVPMSYPTGIFPISSSDPAYQYDTNPNHIALQTLTYSLPLDPIVAATPSCLPLGPIGVVNDGVVLFNSLDAGGRDAVAHETQDACDGHPDGQSMYHYHSIPSCVLDKATAPSTLVGYALDGYGIYVERDSKGNLPTNADLDECHGRTSSVLWNGVETNMYHYDVTLEYPYTLGCFKGTPVVHGQ